MATVSRLTSPVQSEGFADELLSAVHGTPPASDDYFPTYLIPGAEHRPTRTAEDEAAWEEYGRWCDALAQHHDKVDPDPWNEVTGILAGHPAHELDFDGPDGAGHDGRAFPD